MAKSPETPLQMAERHVIEQEARITKQKKLIGRLNAAHLPTEAAAQFLETMEQMLALFVQDYARLSQSNKGTKAVWVR